jgi:hypothetical protein
MISIEVKLTSPEEINGYEASFSETTGSFSGHCVLEAGLDRVDAENASHARM